MDYAVHVDVAHARDLLPVVGVQRALPTHACVVHQDGHWAEFRLGVGDLDAFLTKDGFSDFAGAARLPWLCVPRT
jgi:hypothetical protein